jgi:twitching motility protein PilT
LNNKILRKIYAFSGNGRNYRCKLVLKEHLDEFAIKFFFIPSEVPLLEKLNMPDILPELIDYTSGLIVISSPARNGKTTTLHSLVNLMNHKKSLHIITIEPVIEYMHKNKNSFIVQRESGSNMKGNLFDISLKSGPDVIVIDELDSFESISFALSAAESGKLVLAAMSGTNSGSVISSIIENTPFEMRHRIKDMMSEMLRAIVSQNLLVSGKKNFMIPATEILFSCKKLSAIIKEENLYEIPALIDTASNIGMQSLDKSLLSLYKENIISRQTVLDMIQDIRMFE